MTTHRVIQLSILLDNAESGARSARKAAANLFRIKNLKGTAHYLAKAKRLDRVAARASRRLEAA